MLEEPTWLIGQENHIIISWDLSCWTHMRLSELKYVCTRWRATHPLTSIIKWFRESILNNLLMNVTSLVTCQVHLLVFLGSKLCVSFGVNHRRYLGDHKRPAERRNAGMRPAPLQVRYFSGLSPRLNTQFGSSAGSNPFWSNQKHLWTFIWARRWIVILGSDPGSEMS